jgi:hypothetical protein
MIRSLALALTALTLASAAHAGPIEKACLNSGRDAADRRICACIQGVADQMLEGSDQRRAAKFFSNPELAAKTMLSDSARDDAFWERWERFGETATIYCSPQPVPSE